jgi:hypothetical protein
MNTHDTATAAVVVVVSSNLQVTLGDEVKVHQGIYNFYPLIKEQEAFVS